MGDPKPDFTGWATRPDIKCADGRMIMKDAFAHQFGTETRVKVPLVWSHYHDDPELVLGHAFLEKKEGGIRCEAYFNENPKAKAAKIQLLHGDIESLSIWANGLIEKMVGGVKQVFHGSIKEVSLVLSGANPGAKIDPITVQHGDGTSTELDDEAIIYMGLELEHDDTSDKSKTIKDIYNSMNTEQQDAVAVLIQGALEEAGVEIAHSDDDQDDADKDKSEDDAEKDKGDADKDDAQKDDADKDKSSDDTNADDGKEGNKDMGTELKHKNAFEDADKDKDKGPDGEETHVLSHDDMKEIKETWKRGGSFRNAVNEFALAHGIENLDALFPDAKALGEPEFDKRRTEWVDGVLGGTKKSPFSRVKTLWADITEDKARALGYIKGNLKKEEFFKLLKRTTSPTTVYKKQKLDRDDILDATELKIVPWMKREMEMMLREELARAILLGDGRPVEDPANPGEPNPDKIKDPAGDADGVGIRSVLNDHELFVAEVNVVVPADGASWQPLVEEVMLNMDLYKGTGTPTLYTTRKRRTRMLLSKDGFGRRLWRTKDELASEMGVDDIIAIDVMDEYPDVVGIIVNLQDYNVGTDAGGEVTLFDDFDLDYNQQKWLIETRFSGALVKIRSGLVLRAVAAGAVELADPTEPTMDEDGVVTIPVMAHVVYKNADTGVTLIAGAQDALDPGETLFVKAVASAGWFFNDDQNDEWAFEGPAA